MVHHLEPVSLNQLMQMRVNWINDNRIRILADAVSDMYDEVIEAFVHRGKNYLIYKIPGAVLNFAAADHIMNDMVRDMSIIFPDLKFSLYVNHAHPSIFVDV
jgi:hypothetical protein